MKILDYASAIACYKGLGPGSAEDFELKPTFQIERGCEIFTIGSCITRQLENPLATYGFSIPMLDFMRAQTGWVKIVDPAIRSFFKFSPANIYQEIEAASTIYKRDDTVHDNDYGAFCNDNNNDTCVDTQLIGGIPVTKEHFIERRRCVYQLVKHIFSSRLIIISLGVIEIWIDIKSGLCQPLYPIGINTDNLGFKILSFDECKMYLQQCINLIREVNADSLFLLIVSPVPIPYTVTGHNLTVANTYAKSVLRAVCGEIAAENNGVDYFPLYEDLITRFNPNDWTGVHVLPSAIDRNIERFVKAYLP
jgi:hypothetical protein